MRTNAFVSGGFVPPAARGSTYGGLVHLADWFGVFCELAGANATDTAAEEANRWLQPRGLPTLPPVDSAPGMWRAIVGGKNESVRTVVHHSETSVTSWPYKLITGVQVYGVWTGELYPNCTDGAVDAPLFVDVKIFNEPMNYSRSPAGRAKDFWEHDCGAGCLFDVEVQSAACMFVPVATELALKTGGGVELLRTGRLAVWRLPQD